MKIARFLMQGKPSYAVLENGRLRELAGSFHAFMDWGEEPPFTGRELEPASVTLLAPCTPSKIICIGLNYRLHAREVGLAIPETPVLFMKPSTAVIAPGEKILLPPESSRVDFEAELAVVLGRRAYRVSKEEAHEYILGYTCGNDVTARDLQPPDGQWIYAKGFDTFAPLGPVIETGIKDPHNLMMKGILNSRTVQATSTSDMIFDIPFLVEYISSCMTLLPGDVIMTGTPSGIAPLKEGDTFTVFVEGIGELVNPVAAWKG